MTGVKRLYFTLIITAFVRPIAFTESEIASAAQEPSASRASNPAVPVRALQNPRDEPRGSPSGENANGLRIGYLAEGSDLAPAGALISELREYLLADERVRAAMEEGGFGDVWPRICGNADDMNQRLGEGEFELVFATSVIYARRLRDLFDSSDSSPSPLYEPILQFRLRGDTANPRDVGIWRRAAIFVGPANPLWGTEPTHAEIRREISRGRMAVSDANSAGGYIYPRFMLLEEFGGLRPEFQFCGTGPEVIKHVISGLVPVGAARIQVIEEYGAHTLPNGKRVELVQTLITTGLFPTDPILIRRDLHPQHSEAALGRELRAAIRTYFNSRQKLAPGLLVEDTERRAFEGTVRVLQSLDASRPAGQRRFGPSLPAQSPSRDE